MRIFRFDDFVLNEKVQYPPSVDLPDVVIKAMTTYDSARRELGLLASAKDFKRIYIKDGAIFIDYIDANIGDSIQTIQIPGLRYDKEHDSLGIDYNELKSAFLWDILQSKGFITDNMKSYKGEHDIRFIYDRITVYLIAQLRDKVLDKTKTLDPFTLDLENNKVLNDIKKLGGYIISSEIQKKRGTLVIDHKDFPSPIKIL